MNARTALFAAIVAAFARSAAAQGAPEQMAAPRLVATTPAQCTKAANDWRNEQLAAPMAALRAAKDPEASRAASAAYSARYSVVAKAAQGSARECASHFDVEHAPSSQLADLAALYSYVGDTANSRRATDRALAAKDLTPRAHGMALVLAIGQEITRAGDQFGVNEGAERYTAQIDQLPDSLVDLKMSAHQRMLGLYEYLDVDDGLRAHANAIIALAKRTASPGNLAGAYLSLARASADYLQPDSALAILRDAEKEVGERGTAMFKDFRERYALIGTRAAAVTGEYWLNVTGTPAPVQPGNGRVTLVEFTAHWCKPCKNSYPGMRSLAERYRDKPFDGVLVTSLYGYLGDRRNLTPDQEVEADREYFTKEHAMPFRVAINAPPKDRRGQPQVDTDYRVGGIPQIVVIDKQGVIRQIVTGWDHGNTARFTRLIDQLLSEPIK